MGLLREKEFEAKKEKAIAYYEKHPYKSKRQIAKDLGYSRSCVVRALKGITKDPKEEFEQVSGDSVNQEFDYENGSGSITTKSLNIRTEKQAIEAANVDTSVWKPIRQRVNSWEVTMGGDKTPSGKPETYTNWQVRVDFRPYTAEELGINNLIENIQGRKPTVRKVEGIKKSKSSDKHAAFVGLVDQHFGKLAWEDETGTNYDLKKARTSYLEAIKKMLCRFQIFNIDKIFLPIGQDFLHINNSDNTTMHGTRQDVDQRLAKVFTVACETTIEAIELCAGFADTEVMWVPGNHDYETSYYLMKVMEAYFRNTDQVSIDVSPKSRKYRQYGKTLIGTTHGNEEKHSDLSTIMAAEEKDLWAKSEYFEWFLGHWHKKKQSRYIAQDSHIGVGVTVLPSLCGTDAWHYLKGYVKGRRAAEIHLFGENTGPAGSFPISLGD